jgi:hypothetical protein
MTGYQREDHFAKENGVSQRTVARKRQEPDGIPFTEWGGRVYVHVEGARKYIEQRTRKNGRVVR